MDIETANLKQKAVLWSKTGDDRYGEAELGTATQIRVRWEEGSEEEATVDDATIVADARVFVDRVIAMGSILWLGKKKDLPDPVTNRYQVVKTSSIPDLKGNRYRRYVLLRRYRESS